MCKKLKISESDPFTIKHYKDGDFNKAYDRKLTVSSMTNFMRDPTGDIPWEEDSSAVDVVHIPDSNVRNFINYILFFIYFCILAPLLSSFRKNSAGI